MQTLLHVMLASIRLVPVLGFSPPFTMIKIPSQMRVLVAITLAAAIVGTEPSAALANAGTGEIVQTAASELAIGIAMALALQLAFAAIGFAGRALDIQAGFGLAFLIDPTTRAQVPLIGALFTYAAAAIFFATEGPYDVFAAFSASFRAMPVGSLFTPPGIDGLLALISSLWVVSLGVAGLGMFVLLLIDIAIAMLSRTLPQMNVLVLGFQVKSIVSLLLLPATLALGASAIARILRLAIEAMPRLAGIG